MGNHRNRRLRSLLTLVDDPDPSVFEAVEKQLLKENTRIIPDLETIWETTECEMCQERIEILIGKLRYRDNVKRIRYWIRQPQPDLLEGFLLASCFYFPEISAVTVSRRIEEIRKRVWVELNNSLTSLEKITVLNHILFNEYHFGIIPENRETPRAHSVAHILESRTGGSVAFSMLYLILALKLDLPVRYIDFPRYPVLAYADRRIAAKVHSREVETDVLFYINPASDGSITGRKELEYVIRKMEIGEREINLESGSPELFMVRLFEAMEKTFEAGGNKEKAQETRKLIQILGAKNKSRSTM
jgi:hypothetical protein